MWVLLIIASIGYKPVNISQILLSEIKPQTEHIYLSDSNNDTVSQNCSWMLTEPLGGAVGGIAGGCVLGIVGGISCYLLGKIVTDEDFTGWGIEIGSFGGYLVGVPLGIYYTGKWLEKEKGHFKSAFIGSAAGSIVSAILFYASIELFCYEEMPNPYLILSIPFMPIIGSMIGYRLGLLKKKQ